MDQGFPDDPRQWVVAVCRKAREDAKKGRAEIAVAVGKESDAVRNFETLRTGWHDAGQWVQAYANVTDRRATDLWQEAIDQWKAALAQGEGGKAAGPGASGSGQPPGTSGTPTGLSPRQQLEATMPPLPKPQRKRA